MTSVSPIYMVPLDHVSESTLAALETRVEQVFDREVIVRTSTSDAVAVSFDATRNQYNSSLILALLLDNLPPGDAKAIAVTGLDLFVPVLTFVFGEAQLNGRVAVASEFRLRNEFYGLPGDEELTCDRFEKEVVHELGHTFGLRHCDNPSCVMHASTAVEEVDIKQVQLCPSCHRLAGLHPSVG